VAQLRQRAAAGRSVSLHARLGGSSDSGPVGPGAAHQPAAEDLFGRIQALNDEDDIRNLQHSYGAYVDRRMWSDVVDLFVADGTLQIAGVGTFKGSAGIRQALEQTMGPEGLAQFILNEHPLWDTIAPSSRRTAYGSSKT